MWEKEPGAGTEAETSLGSKITSRDDSKDFTSDSSIK